MMYEYVCGIGILVDKMAFVCLDVIISEQTRVVYIKEERGGQMRGQGNIRS